MKLPPLDPIIHPADEFQAHRLGLRHFYRERLDGGARFRQVGRQVVLDGDLFLQEFGDDVSVISLMITVDPDIKPGNYSIFVNGRNDAVSCLIGAFSID